jgi:hypothetical protein
MKKRQGRLKNLSPLTHENDGAKGQANHGNVMVKGVVR